MPEKHLVDGVKRHLDKLGVYRGVRTETGLRGRGVTVAVIILNGFRTQPGRIKMNNLFICSSNTTITLRALLHLRNIIMIVY